MKILRDTDRDTLTLRHTDKQRQKDRQKQRET